MLLGVDQAGDECARLGSRRPMSKHPHCIQAHTGMLEARIPPQQFGCLAFGRGAKAGSALELLSASRKPGQAGSSPGKHPGERKQLTGARPSLVPTLHKRHAAVPPPQKRHPWAPSFSLHPRKGSRAKLNPPRAALWPEPTHPAMADVLNSLLSKATLGLGALARTPLPYLGTASRHERRAITSLSRNSFPSAEVLPCFPPGALNPLHGVVLQREALPEQLFGTGFVRARLSRQHTKCKRVCSERFYLTIEIQSLKREISMAGKIRLQLARQHGGLQDERLISTSMKEHRGVMAAETPITWSETWTPPSHSSWESINPPVRSDTHHEEPRSEQPCHC